jgi:hypothetical protein
LLIALIGFILFFSSLVYGNSIPLSVGSCVLFLATFWAGVGMIAVAFAYSVVSLILQVRQILRLRRAWKQTHQTEGRTNEPSS